MAARGHIPAGRETRDMLGDVLLHHQNEVVEVGRQKLRRLHPDAADDSSLYDVIGFLDEVRIAMTSRNSREHDHLPTTSAASIRHGLQRHATHFDPASVVHDYGAMCDAVMETACRLEIPVAAEEAQLLNRCVDSATADAIRAYWMRDKEQTERRHIEDTGVLAHELRNALSAATVAARVITAGQTPLTGRTSAVLSRSLARMRELIDRSLVEVRLRGQATVHLARARIGDIVREVEEGILLERHVRFEADVVDLELEADTHLIASALVNLVQNAVKFTRDGGRVQLRVAESGANVVAEIEDECGGLTQQAMDDMFKPFVQSGRDRRGVGLGLMIARRAAELHAGTLEVRNLPGKGCVLILSLPMVATAVVPAFRAD